MTIEPMAAPTQSLPEIDPADLATFTGGEVRAANVPGEIRIEVPASLLPSACDRLSKQLQTRLATMVGEDDRDGESGGFRLSYIFAPTSGGWITIETTINASDPTFPAITPLVPAANWYEREVQDLLGLVPVGHPNPARLVLHENWPSGIFPLRKDFDPSIPVPTAEASAPSFHHLHGEGIVEIPVGPIHAGVIEPGHFRFAAVGEEVLHLETRLFFTHRGIEKLVEGKSAAQVLPVAERICGVCSLSHAVAYCQAVELIAGDAPPPRAQAIRTLLLELERLYNHVGDLGNVCAGVGFAVGASTGARLKEDLQRLNERLSGNRFLRGICQLGGVRRDLTVDAIQDLDGTLTQFAKEFADFINLVVGSETTMERFTSTGILSPENARQLATVGIAARSSGVDVDCRRDHPYSYYDQLPMPVPVVVRQDGDVKARVLNRMDEVIASLAIVRAILAHLPDGPISRTIGALPPNRVGYSATESPRGENLHWLRTGANGQIARYRVRSASYPNWPAVAASVPGNIVPDFPLINKSFELCYACLDR